jgi:hypothetical protein
MRIPTPFAIALVAAATVASGHARADGSFIELQTPSMQITKFSGNGAYAVGSVYGTAAVRWTAASGSEDILPDLVYANGINNDGTISGAVGENGGSANGGRDLGAYLPVGGAPVLLTSPLQTNSDGWDIADNGSVVGLSYDDGFAGAAVAYVWTAAEGMTALPVNRPDTYSRANMISADGSLIVGYNDQEDGSRTGVVWKNRVVTDLVDGDGIALQEASAVSSNGAFVVGSNYFDADGNSGAYRWNAATGEVDLIPGMVFAFGVTDDGNTIVGANGFFDDPPRAALIWHKGTGTETLVTWLAGQDIAIPDGWDPDLAGGFGAISGNGALMGGWSFGPAGIQSYIIELAPADAVFVDGFDGT